MPKAPILIASQQIPIPCAALVFTNLAGLEARHRESKSGWAAPLVSNTLLIRFVLLMPETIHQDNLDKVTVAFWNHLQL
jgi:hypothetical protein